jgi:hypothetical protein
MGIQAHEPHFPEDIADSGRIVINIVIEIGVEFER